MKNKSIEKFDLFFFAVTVILILIFAVFAKAQNDQISAPKIVATGGAFTLEKAVVAGGGRQMSNQPIVQNGTAGQSIAGVRSSAGQFSLYSGFWTPDDFAPTAAVAVVGGRIKTAQGRGIRNVIITIRMPNGESRITTSTAFGYYRFSDIPTGETYVFSISATRHNFVQTFQVRQILDDTQDIDFVAEALTF